jgi:hypothetical protein
LSVPEGKHRPAWSRQGEPEPVHGAIRRCLSNATRVAHVPYSATLPRDEPQSHQSDFSATRMPTHSHSEPNPRPVNTLSSSPPPSRPHFPNPSHSMSSHGSYDSVDSHALSLIHTPPDDKGPSGVNIVVWPGSDEGDHPHHAAGATRITESIRRLSFVGHNAHNDDHTNKGASPPRTNTNVGWHIRV